MLARRLQKPALNVLATARVRHATGGGLFPAPTPISETAYANWSKRGGGKQSNAAEGIMLSGILAGNMLICIAPMIAYAFSAPPKE